MTRIAFCGLGRMGSPMAARLVDAGHDVTVWNRTPNRAASLLERGAAEAVSPAEAAAGADVVVTMVSDPDALERADDAGLGGLDYSAVIAQVRRRPASGPASSPPG